MRDAEFSVLRERMLAEIDAKTIFSTARLGKAALGRRTLEAMAKVPRHLFVPDELRDYAYADTPLPIGFDKTISQPFIVAVMTDLLDVQPTDTVLEVGTGLGYQCAVLAELAARVYSVERIGALARAARTRLAQLGVGHVEVRTGDGAAGWAEHAPFDRIIVTAAPLRVPPALIDQLRPGGRLVLPLGPADDQRLVLIRKLADGALATTEVFGVRFSQLDPAAPD